MTHDEMMALNVNDLVTVTKSGKVYRVYSVTHAGDVVPHRVWGEQGLVTKDLPFSRDRVDFVQQRNGKDYGRVCELKPENIERHADIAQLGHGDATLTKEEETWLNEAGRMVRFVVVDKNGKRRCSQGIGIPKTSTILGKARNGVRLPVAPGYGDGGPMGPGERKIEADQRAVRG